MENLNALTDTTLTIMSYNVQMLSVPLSNQINLSTRQDAVIDYICSLDDLHNIDILVLNEVFTSNCYDMLTKGKVKDKFPYHTNVIGTKCQGPEKWSSSIVEVKEDSEAGTSTNGKAPKKKATAGKAPAPSELNRKVVSAKAPLKAATTKAATTKAAASKGAPPKAATSKAATTKAVTSKGAPPKAAPSKAAPHKAAPSKAAPPKAAPPKAATSKVTPPRGQETSILNSSDTNNNDQEEAGETLHLDSSDTNNRGDSECILSLGCGLESGNKVKGKPTSRSYKAVPNGNGKRGGKRDGAEGAAKVESTSSDKKAQCSETDDGMAVPGKRQNRRVSSRGAAGADKLSEKSGSLLSNQSSGQRSNQSSGQRSNQSSGQRSDKAGSSKRAKGAGKKEGPGKNPQAKVGVGTKESRSSNGTNGKVSTQRGNPADGKVSTQRGIPTDGKVITQGGNPTKGICDATSEAKTSVSNSVSSAENVKEKKWEGKKKKKKKNNQQNVTSFDSVSGKSKFYQVLNGGVIVLSKHAFMHKHALIYSNCKFPDMFCTKGAIYLKCCVNNKPVNVIATHLQAGDTSDQQNCRWKQLNELSNWVYNGAPSFHIKKNEPLFFVGDFNIRYHLDKSFFDRVLSSGCLNSSVTKKALETTYDSYLNDYCMHMERDYSFKYNYTLDYILVNNDSDVKTLVPQTAIQKDYRPIQIIKSLLGFIPYKCTYIHHPSDHFPIYATFKIPNQRGELQGRASPPRAQAGAEVEAEVEAEAQTQT
ncbi:sphingomyelin phosphodiesterase, putative [Plasmodium vivax]|uniref:Sphingomyelin phosphodiesterase, putative n=1 Tax=Plasmodium vivax TaxID=5855 RepID=A0A565A567_PLAVI|nr:sphingomyelin phosphodiesterase, putative [Plasmodium vivax]